MAYMSKQYDRTCVTIFNTVFQPVSNFTELHALPLAACSYALLIWVDINAYLGCVTTFEAL